MPYKIVLQGDHGGVLDHETVVVPKGTTDTEALKAKLHEKIDEWELSEGDRITIMGLTDAEADVEENFTRIIAEIEAKR